MRRTVILQPFSEGEIGTDEKKILQDNYDAIKTFQLEEEAAQLT